MTDNDTGAAVALAALVPSIFAASLPPLAQVRREADDDGSNAAAIRTAAIVASCAVLAVAGMTASRRVLVVGALSVVGFTGVYAHARGLEPWQI